MSNCDECENCGHLECKSEPPPPAPCFKFIVVYNSAGEYLGKEPRYSRVVAKDVNDALHQFKMHASPSFNIVSVYQLVATIERTEHVKPVLLS